MRPVHLSLTRRDSNLQDNDGHCCWWELQAEEGDDIQYGECMYFVLLRVIWPLFCALQLQLLFFVGVGRHVLVLASRLAAAQTSV